MSTFRTHAGHERRDACCDEQAARQTAFGGAIVLLPRDTDAAPHLALDEVFAEMLCRADEEMTPVRAEAIRRRLVELIESRSA